MRTRLTWGLCLGLAACAEPGTEAAYQRIEGAAQTVEVAGQALRVVLIENEPFGHVFGVPDAIGLDGRHIEVEPPTLTDPPYQRAVRIEGAGKDDFDTALMAFARVCGYPYAQVKDWGAYGDPIWQDPRDNAVVLWTEECPGLGWAASG